MKKVTLILSALALVLGLSQCKKQETPAQSGEKQHIVLTANNGNDGSKVAASFASAALNLTWEGNETITVSGGASGTLTYKSGVGTPNATFEGDIRKGEGDVVFTIGSAPEDEDFAGQAGTADACATLINANNHFVGTSSYQPSGSYEVQMRLQYAVLKLDVSALGTSGEMTIAANGATVASVTNVASSEGKAVFVAVPTDETEKAYTITCNGKAATKTWTLEKNVFYTKAGAEGAGTGEAIVIEPDAPATPKFTVGMDGDTPITVEFAPGNLYWDGTESKFKFEANQWSTTPASGSTWDASHVSHFYWSNTTDWQTSGKEPYASSYSYSTRTTSDVFFTEASGFQVNGETAGTWHTLSNAEWGYLLYTRDNALSLRAWVTLSDVSVSGLVILPDGSSATASGITTSSALADAGAVFLPAAGYRNGTDVDFVGSHGYYWSGTPHEGIEDYAYLVDFDSGFVNVFIDRRNYGVAVRLVR